MKPSVVPLTSALNMWMNISLAKSFAFAKGKVFWPLVRKLEENFSETRKERKHHL